MASEKKRGLGRGLGALIPQGNTALAATTPPTERPVDVFFPDKGNVGVAEDSSKKRPKDSVVGSTATSNGDKKPSDLGSKKAKASAVESVSEKDSTKQHGGGDTSPEKASQTSAPTPGAGKTSTRDDDLKEPSTKEEAAARVSRETRKSVPPMPTRSDPTSVASLPVDDLAEHQSDGLVPVPGARFAEIGTNEIRPNAKQPRSVFDEDELDELAASIVEVGVLQPVVVREDPAGGYELIMGERRWRATQLAGLTSIPAIIRDTDDSDLLRDALLENLHRSQLNPLEEAAAYEQLLRDFDCTHEELATRVARSRPQISNTLRLLKLPPLVQRRLAAGVLSAGHARAILGLSDGGAMERLAQRIVAEGLSVRATEEIVALGGDVEPKTKPREPQAGHRNEALENLASRLSDRFETRVKIALGKSKGRLTVEFASVQDLNRIIESIAPEDPGLLK